jgi:hypothetical protein
MARQLVVVSSSLIRLRVDCSGELICWTDDDGMNLLGKLASFYSELGSLVGLAIGSVAELIGVRLCGRSRHWLDGGVGRRGLLR